VEQVSTRVVGERRAPCPLTAARCRRAGSGGTPSGT